MMKFQHTFLSLLAGFALSMTGGCVEDTASSQRAIIESPCATNADCPANFECEVEVEHGQTTSFCQSHNEDGSCPAGFELEVEHGQAFCKPHGGGADDRGSDDRGPDDRGSGRRNDDGSGSGHR